MKQVVLVGNSKTYNGESKKSSTESAFLFYHGDIFSLFYREVDGCCLASIH